MLVKVLLVLFVQGMLLLPMGYASSSITLEQRMWFADISAHGRYVSSNYNGDIDLEKDLGFTNSKVPQTRLMWDIDSSHSIRMDYFEGRFTGAADRKERREFFGGLISREIRYHADENLGMKFWKIGWISYAKSHVDDKVRVGFLLDVKRISLHGTAMLTTAMDGSLPITLGEQSSWRMTAPTIGFVITGKPNHRLHYFVECSGLTNGGNGFLFADYEASIKWFADPKRNTSIVVGYHGIHYDNYKKTDQSKLEAVKIAGVFYGVERKF